MQYSELNYQSAVYYNSNEDELQNRCQEPSGCIYYKTMNSDLPSNLCTYHGIKLIKKDPRGFCSDGKYCKNKSNPHCSIFSHNINLNDGN